MSSFMDLAVWQVSMELVEEVYTLCIQLPRFERSALADQLRRAAVSIPSNISEGYARFNPKEFLRFLRIAQGSAAEVQTQLLICARVNYATSEQVQPALELVKRVGKLLYNFSRAQERIIEENAKPLRAGE